MNEAEENRVREDLERQYGRITAARSKGRAAFFFRPATFDEWRDYRAVGADDLLVAETLAVSCCVWSAEGLDVKTVAHENGNFGIMAAQQIRRISGGSHKIDHSAEAGTVELRSPDGATLLTFHKPPFEEVQRYTTDVKGTRHPLVPRLTYALGAVDGDREDAKAKLKAAPACIKALVLAIEDIASGDFDFEGN